MAQDQKPITFGKEIDPAEEEVYREKVRQAKAGGGVNSLKGQQPVGVVPRPSIPLSQKAVDAADEIASAIAPDGSVRPRPPGSPVLSPQTASMLREAADAAVKNAKTEAEEKAAEEPEKKETDLFELFDFQGRSEAERVLNNRKRRTAIESRCAEMTIEDLLLRDEVQQLVPIVPGKLEVLFRSMTPEENLFIKQYVMQKDGDKNEMYLSEKFALCQLTCSLVAINHKALLDHRNAEGSPTEPLFEQKMKQLLKKSGYVIADLGINYMWFDIRVRRLFNPDNLGNG